MSVVEWKEGPAGHGMTLYLICGQANKDSVDLVSDVSQSCQKRPALNPVNQGNSVRHQSSQHSPKPLATTLSGSIPPEPMGGPRGLFGVLPDSLHTAARKVSYDLTDGMRRQTSGRLDVLGTMRPVGTSIYTMLYPG